MRRRELLAGLALQIFLQPVGLTESDLTPFQQHLVWIPYTPLMLVFGLAQAASWPNNVPHWAPWVALAVFALHAIFGLTRTRRFSFAIAAGIQVLLLAVAVIYFVRQSLLPSGG